MEIWGHMECVQKLEEYVSKELERLKNQISNPRIQRQMNDGERFLRMIHSITFCQIKTVGELRKAISKRRSELKEISKDMARLLPNHQFSLFEKEEEVSEKRSKELQIQKCILEEEIYWLHKALGICNNKKYFK